MSLLHMFGICIFHRYGGWYVWDASLHKHRYPNKGEFGRKICDHCNHVVRKQF